MEQDIQLIQLTNKFLMNEVARLQHENAALKARLYLAEGEVKHEDRNTDN